VFYRTKSNSASDRYWIKGLNICTQQKPRRRHAIQRWIRTTLIQLRKWRYENGALATRCCAARAPG